jgi:hypothetical protein
MINKYIESLKILDKPKLGTFENLKAWQGKVINILVRVYGENSIQEEQVKNIVYKKYASYSINAESFGGGNNLGLCENQASEVINGFISDLETFGLPVPKVKESNGINISLNQTQNQTVNLNLILESIKEELTGKQTKELDEILKCEEEPEAKKIKVLGKLKSFGSDVLSNIIANIITNPAIYGG